MTGVQTCALPIYSRSRYFLAPMERSAGFFYRPRVSVQRHTPKTAVVGQPLNSQISVSNEASHGLYNFSVRELIVPAGRWPREWQRPHRMALAPGQNTTLTVSFEPQKRGVLSLSGLALQSYRSEEHTSELHHKPISYAVFCLKKKKK